MKEFSFQRSSLRKAELIPPGVRRKCHNPLSAPLALVFFSSSNTYTIPPQYTRTHHHPHPPTYSPFGFAFSHLLPGFISSDWSSCQGLWHRDELHCYKRPGTKRSGNGYQRTTTINISLQGYDGGSWVSDHGRVCAEEFLEKLPKCVIQQKYWSSMWSYS